MSLETPAAPYKRSPSPTSGIDHPHPSPRRLPGAEVLRQHERIVLDGLRKYQGVEIKAMGDGFMASFGSAVAAVECAIAIQRSFAEHNATADEPIRIGVGIERRRTDRRG